jgi:tetratricopeptide (TPR) repeat protein
MIAIPPANFLEACELRWRGEVSYERHEYDEASNAAQEGIQLLDSLDCPIALCSLRSNLRVLHGRALLRLGRPSDAFEIAQVAIDELQALGRPIGPLILKADAYLTMAKIGDQSMLLQAYTYFEESYAHARFLKESGHRSKCPTSEELQRIRGLIERLRPNAD